MTWGVTLLVSYHFAFSYCSWGSQGKNTEVACHSLLQSTLTARAAGWCTKHGQELPHLQSQGQRPRVPGCDGAGTAGGATQCPRSGAVGEKSYPASEVSGSREETPHVRGQGRPGEATSRPRPGVVTLRSHPEPEARGGSWEEPPTPEDSASSPEEHPEEQRGLEELSHLEGQERRQ